MAPRTSRRRLRADATEKPPRPATRLSRAYLEEAFTRLTEENARLRREVMAGSGLWQIAHQDPLTGLWNRRYADERLTEELSRARRETDHRFSLVLVDVDNMKRINDERGHASGDDALKWVARFLKQGLRGHDLCCRLGGDEFLLILPGSGEQECRELVARIRRRWNSAATTGDQRAVAVSIGTASFPDHGDTIEALLNAADDGMYADKRRRDPGRPARPPQAGPAAPRGGDVRAKTRRAAVSDGETAHLPTRSRNRAESF
ncbi:MAG: GGDEF domain-containing protein [Pseudomonadota bacterium]